MEYRSETQGRVGQSGSILDGCYAKVEDARVRPRQDWALGKSLLFTITDAWNGQLPIDSLSDMFPFVSLLSPWVK